MSEMRNAPTTAAPVAESGAWSGPPAAARAAIAGWSPCECGCGASCPRRFRPGHDAKLKGELIRLVLAAGPEAPAARARVERLGWAGHLRLSEEAAAKRAATKAAGGRRRAPSSRPLTKPAARPKPTAADAVWLFAGVAETRVGDGRVPASVGRLSGKVGRKAKV
jgi:hypothetical protein